MNDPNATENDGGELSDERPFKLTVTMHPSFLSAAYVVERDISQVDALTFLKTIRQGIQVVGEPSDEDPEIYIATLRNDSHECFSIRDDRFCFELSCMR